MKIILFILLQTFLQRHSDGTTTNNVQEQENRKRYSSNVPNARPPKPCKKPPCAVPLTDWLPVLALAGVAYGIHRLKSI